VHLKGRGYKASTGALAARLHVLAKLGSALRTSQFAVIAGELAHPRELSDEDGGAEALASFKELLAFEEDLLLDSGVDHDVQTCEQGHSAPLA
jgi:hypothetical protein